MIKIICVGKIKEEYLRKLIEDYKKRIEKYHKIQIIEVKDEDNITKERNNVLKYLDPKDYIITLEIEGKSFTSEEFSKHLEHLFIKTSNIKIGRAHV